MFRVIRQIWSNFKEYIVLVILLIASLVTISLNHKPEVKKVRAAAFGSFAIVSSVLSETFGIASIRSENTELRKINAELMLQVSRLRQFAIENEELRTLAGLKDTTSLPLIPAAIVSRSLSRTQGTVTLNAGNSNGVKPGMPVITGHGLLGIVYSTSENFSIVRTLQNTDLKLTVKDERSRVDAVMKWNGQDLIMVDVPKTYDIEPGDRIVTSDLSSVVAVPLPVGVVIGFEKLETGIFNEVKIRPFVDFLRAENVFVVGIVESMQKKDLELNFYNR